MIILLKRVKTSRHRTISAVGVKIPSPPYSHSLGGPSDERPSEMKRPFLRLENPSLNQRSFSCRVEEAERRLFGKHAHKVSRKTSKVVVIIWGFRC